MGGGWGDHYGYEYLATMLGDAAESNPNLALGPKFFEGKDSIAHDIIAFDHEHGDEIAAAGGYGNWGTSQSLFDGLSASLEGHELPEGSFRINVPQGGSGYEFLLSRYLVDQIRGKGDSGNGLFTDLAFDQPFDLTRASGGVFGSWSPGFC